MLLAFSILGIFLSVILVYFNARKYPSSIYLGGFFFLISVYGFIQYTLLYSRSVFLISVVFINIGFLTYLTGPMLYLYVRSVLTDDTGIKKIDWLHLTPMLLYLVGAFSYFITPWSFKMQTAAQLAEGFENIRNFQQAGMYQFLPKVFVFVSRPMLVLGYTFWSAIIFFKYVAEKKNDSVFVRQRFMIKWMLILLGFLSLLAISQIFLLLKSFSDRNLILFNTLNSLQFLSGLGLAGLLISPFFFPEVLYGLPRVPDLSESNPVSTPAEQVKHPEKGKSEPHFENDYLDLIREQSTACMQEFQPFLQPEFNLIQLSVLMRVPVHHLAYYFREVEKQTFSDFRNEWRIEHAKTLIREGKSNDLTLEAIGILSGFSSRNTFLKAFKKAEGISPQAFLARTKSK
jgi:AraC-like DNA-binding protein